MSRKTVLVVNGDGAAGALRAAGLANDVTEADQSAAGPTLLVLRDVLSCGSLGAARLSRGLGAWQEAREAFWRRVWADALHWGWVDEPFGAVARLPCNLYREIDSLERADTVIACVGAGLSDQLMLAFLAAWFGQPGLDSRRLQVAAYLEPGVGSTGAPPAGLPHLDPQALAAAWAPRPLGQDERRTLEAFWDDYALADEAARKRWLEAGGSAARGRHAPTLAAARGAWASRVPAPPGDLAAWDRALLEASSTDALPLRAVLGQALRANGVHADPVGDLVLLHRIAMLSNPSDERAWWTLGAPGGPATSCALTAYGASLIGFNSRASADSRTSDWLRGLEPRG
jgi:hypothetical protein